MLGPRIGAGGEGTVFNVVGSPELAAKIYDQPGKRPPLHQEAKLCAMISLTRQDLLDVTAWPTATLHERPSGRFCGFIMRKLKELTEIHCLYSPAHRKAVFPHADWRFLVHTAMNCAAAFDTIHGCDVVVGDVNQGNVSVSANGLVTLLDCDSYRVQKYPCSEVGIDLFTPPELQGRSFHGVDRTTNHDRFGLAVLVFYLLFMNRHPFAGQYIGAGEMTIGQAIKQHRFAYGRMASTFQMKTPPHALPLSAVSPQLAELFERAFGQESSKPDARPAPSEWVRALRSLLGSLRACTSNPPDPGHVYSTHLANCPWCALMRQGGPNFFITVAYSRSSASPSRAPFVLSTVWAGIDQVPRPVVAYTRPRVPHVSNPRPWPVGLARTVAPRPALPNILAVPTVLPDVNNPAKTVIQCPACSRKVRVPANLGALSVRCPACGNRWKWRLLQDAPKELERGRGQAVIGIVASACGLTFAPLCVFSVVLGASGYNWTGAGVGVLWMVTFFGFAAFAVWWAILESRRRQKIVEFSREHEAELARRQAESQRHATELRRDLANQQAEARRKHKADLAHWEQAFAPVQSEIARRRQAFIDVQQQLQQTEKKWTATGIRVSAEFARKKSDLQAFRDRYNELVARYAAKRERLQATSREGQFRLFLQQQFISDYQIPMIGEGRKATLASYGVETAFDIVEEKVLGVPGFNAGLTGRLMRWRLSVERRFVFNVAAGIPAREQQALDAEFAHDRLLLESGLLSGERELKDIAFRAENEFRHIHAQITVCLQNLAQADADIAAIPNELGPPLPVL
jgi:DNA-binding helix-hairpin-helix protein with protein kinase domain